MLKRVKSGLLIFSITLISLGGIEILSGLILKSGLFFQKELATDISNVYPVQDLEAIQEMFVEHGQIEYQWEPFLHQRAQPFHGEYININNNLVRNTTQFHSTDLDVIKIFAFGGSTMWGDGARDPYTIPSWLSKMIHNDSLPPVQITNFGNSAYLRTHENILLMKELQKGHIPDIVIFYDGVNDAISCGFHHAPGIPQSAINRSKEFNVQGDRRRLLSMLIRASFTVRLIRQMLPRQPFEPQETVDYKGLTASFVEHYRQSLNITDALAKAYGFICLNYWQPVIYTKEHLTNMDQVIIDDIPYYQPYFQAFYQGIREDVGLNNRKNFRDISFLLDDTTQYYYDLCHISEEGNRLIAEEMYPEVKPLVLSASRMKTMDD